jgi:hypothetical protein
MAVGLAGAAGMGDEAQAVEQGVQPEAGHHDRRVRRRRNGTAANPATARRPKVVGSGTGETVQV